MQIIQGKHAVLEAIQQEAPIDRVLMTHPVVKSAEGRFIAKEARRYGIRVQTGTKQEVERHAQGQSQGIVAFLREWKFSSLDVLIENPEAFPIVVALDHLEDPYNVGAVIRTCAAFGVKALLFPKDRQCQITGGVIKAASGGIHHVELIRVTNLATSLQQLKESGFWLYSTNVKTGDPLPKVSPNTPLVLILGNELKGVSPRIQKMVDCDVHIPMSGHMESLNVSVAAGILLYGLHAHD